MYIDPILQNKTKLHDRKQRDACVVICIVKRSEKDTPSYSRSFED